MSNNVFPNPLPVEVVSPNPVNTDWYVQVANGNVPGYSLVAVQMEGEVGAVYEDLWGGSADMIYPVTDEVWEIVSDNANDTLLGSGARTVQVISLDADKLTQIQVVEMDGITPVTLTGTHTRPQSITVIDSGSTGWNEGKITLSATGSGYERNIILPEFATSFDCHFTVPSDKIANLIQTFIFYPKNTSANGFTHVSDGANPNKTWVRSGVIPGYQNLVNLNILAKFPLAPETDINVRFKADTGTAEITAIYEFLLVDKDLAPSI